MLLLDFDGTVCLGDGPVLAYADAAFAELPLSRRDPAHDQLRRFLEHDPQLRQRFADGYVLVQELAADLPPAQLQSAYLHSRERLAAGELAVRPADGLAELLIGVGADVTTVVLTNSPRIGVAETLDGFGLSGLLDQVIIDGGKPARMAEHLDVLLSGQPAENLISVGDHWVNDVRVPVLRGSVGALITGSPRPDHPAHLVGAGLAEVAAGIACWADDPSAFITDHPLPTGQFDRAGTP